MVEKKKRQVEEVGTGREEARQPCERLGLSRQDDQGGACSGQGNRPRTHERSALSPDSTARALPPVPA